MGTYIYLILGFLSGAILSWIIASLYLKIKRVPRADLKKTLDKLNESELSVRLEKERSDRLTRDILELRNINDSLALENKQVGEQSAGQKARLDSVTEKADSLGSEVAELKRSLAGLSDELNITHRELSASKEANKALQDKLDTQKKEIGELGIKIRMEFENIASKILDEKSDKFTRQNKENLEFILKPLGENIDTFRKKIEDVYDKEAKERFSLGREVQRLMELNRKVSEDAVNLTKALKGSSKTQGDWGQMILENILEQSGLEKDREYFVQEFIKDDDGNYIKNEEGRRLQPDIIIRYPDDRRLIIDSKVSLNAYTRYVAAAEDESRERAVRDHLLSVKRHIEDLSGKSYQDFEPGLDFVMMFIPVEPAYMLALKNDQDLWNYAYQRRILLISPTNLIAALKLIEDLWKREYQGQNAQAIADRGAALYDKFVNFVDNLSGVGTNLEKAKKSYDDAFGQLKTGRGNLIGQAEKLKKLGVKAKKNLPSSLASEALTEPGDE